MNSSSSASEQMPPAQDTSGADQFDRRQMLAAVIGFLILVAGGYSATWGDLTPLQATTLRITVCLSVAGLVASAISMIPAIHIEAALAKIVLFAGIAATGIISYATFPTADRVGPHVSAEMDKGAGQFRCAGEPSSQARSIAIVPIPRPLTSAGRPRDNASAASGS
jgi:hypothetical protein